MKKIVNRLLDNVLKIGFFETVYLKLIFRVNTACHISAFSLSLSEVEFKQFYENCLLKLLGKKNNDLKCSIIECLMLLFRNEKSQEYNALYQSILNDFSSMNIEVFSVNRWKTLSSFFTCNGMFQIGEICRCKAKECLLKRKDCFGDEWRKAIVLLENRDFEGALKYINKIERNIILKNFYEEEIISLKIYYELLTGKKILEFCGYEGKDSDFNDIVKGQELLVIGPAPMKEEFPFEDKDYIAIRNNERRENDDISYKTERKTDISYYNGVGSKWIRENKDLDFIEQFKYVVLKNRDDWKQEKMRIRKTLPVDALFFIGTFNVLPIIVIDVWRFNIKSLSVCGNNLFLSKNPHKSDYIAAEQVRKKYDKWRSFAVHEMSSQLLFLRNAYISNRFIPDDELKSVIELSTREYVKQMEEIYVN